MAVKRLPQPHLYPLAVDLDSVLVMSHLMMSCYAERLTIALQGRFSSFKEIMNVSLPHHRGKGPG